MKKHILRILQSFCFSSAISLICLLIIESIGEALDPSFSVMTPEFASLFPTQRIAFGVDLLLYGLLGAAFSGWTAIYECDRIGFVIQNLIYSVGTAVVWIPIVTLIWQLQKYPPALIFTILGFFVSHVIVTIITYKTTRKDIEQLNRILSVK